MKFFVVFGLLLLDYFSFFNLRTEANNIVVNDTYNDKSKRKKNLINLEIYYNDQSLLKEFKYSLKKDIVQLEKKLSNVKNQPDFLDAQVNEIDIVSDSQYFIGDIFYGEGNVTLFFKNIRLEGDKVIYDKLKKEFTVEGNVIFKKGDQYIEATKLVYNFNTGNGSIDNAYGVLDIENFNSDFDINKEEVEIIKNSFNKNQGTSDINLIDTSRIGLVNNFDPTKKFNITKAQLEIPSITKWRFKTEKFFINNEILSSKNISFTNDIFNKPQFVLNSRDFSVQIIQSKLKLITGKSTVIFDDKVKFPIGKRSIFDKDSITNWKFGSDYTEKDGFYLGRNFDEILINKNSKLKLQPYILIQRAISGETNSFRAPNSSILSNKVKNKITDLDFLALDADMNSSFKLFDIDLSTKLNTLNFDRLSESFRSKLTISKSFDLNKNDTRNINESNTIDVQIYNVFREEVFKGYAGEEEIYFGSGFNIANNRNFSSNDVNSKASLIYDFGKFKAKANSSKKFEDLFRNVFAFSYDYVFPLWEKNNLDQSINKSYKYTPVVIKQGLNWNTNLKAGLFLYSDDSSQKAISVTTGPSITLGSFTNNYFDFTSIGISSFFTSKDGKSPFAFDDIDNTLRVQVNLSQQIYGPLIFSYESYINLDNKNADYGKFSKPKYGLDFKRRAYSIGAFYDTSSKALGLQFNISNFDYSGLSPKF